MNISVNLIVILISANIVKTSLLDPVIENVVHREAPHPPTSLPGIWKKKTIWKPRWVKEWKSEKVTKPVWKKVWSPVQIKEWVPIPKPPPGWDSSASTPLKPVKEAIKVNKEPTTIIKEIRPNIPLWDPVPYPESQQPPPPATPYYPPCRDDGCGEPSTFSQQQISGIIGAHKYHHHDSAHEYSETVTQLTRVPPGGNYWRQPPQPNFGFNSPGLPGFLIPPKYQNNVLNFQFGNQNQQPRLQNYNNFNSHQNNNHNYHPVNNHNYNKPNNIQVSYSSGFELQQQNQNNGQQGWTSLHSHIKNNNNNQMHTNSNNIKGHFITKAPDQPYKFEIPYQANQHFNTNTNQQEAIPGANPGTQAGTQTQSSNPRPQAEAEDIQQAELVGEYHYSDFDLTKSVQSVPQTPQPIPPPVTTTNPLPPRKQTPQQHQPRPQNYLQPQKPHQNQTKTSKPQRPQNHPKTQVPQQSPQTSKKPVPKQEVTKHQQLVVESRPRQVRTENKNPPPQNFFNPRSATTQNPNFEVEKAITQDIFPIFKPLPNFDIFPSNHRFAPITNNNVLDTNTTLPKTKTHITFHYLPSEGPTKADVSQDVKETNENYETTTETTTTTTTSTTTTETTTPFTVYSSSSFQTSTEVQTPGPVYIVTPSYTAKSLS